MDENRAFAVPINRLEITVQLRNGVPIEGEIYLEHVTQDLSAHQKLVLFLENNNAFFPIKVAASGRTEFINKKNVQIFEVVVADGQDTAYFANLFMLSIPIVAHFSDGSMVQGDLMAEVPKEKARLSDCLNLSTGFLCIKSGSRMRYINRDALQKVVHADSV